MAAVERALPLRVRCNRVHVTTPCRRRRLVGVRLNGVEAAPSRSGGTNGRAVNAALASARGLATGNRLTGDICRSDDPSTDWPSSVVSGVYKSKASTARERTRRASLVLLKSTRLLMDSRDELLPTTLFCTIAARIAHLAQWSSCLANAITPQEPHQRFGSTCGVTERCWRLAFALCDVL